MYHIFNRRVDDGKSIEFTPEADLVLKMWFFLFELFLIHYIHVSSILLLMYWILLIYLILIYRLATISVTLYLFAWKEFYKFIVFLLGNICICIYKYMNILNLCKMKLAEKINFYWNLHSERNKKSNAFEIQFNPKPKRFSTSISAILFLSFAFIKSSFKLYRISLNLLLQRTIQYNIIE